MIWLSENLDCFIAELSSSLVENSTSDPDYLQGVLPSHLRDEYKFAKEFMEALHAPDSMHPFLREKGFQAIAGDNQLSADEVEYLLSLQKPDQALRDYVLGKRYLDHLPHMGNLQVKFRAKYEGSWSRNWRKTFYLLAYTLLVFLALSPLLCKPPANPS